MSREPADHPVFANAHVVTDQLLVGGDFDTFDRDHAAKQVRELVDRGLTHVLDVRLEWDDTDLVAELAPDVRYRHDGIDDAGQRVPAAWFEGLTWWAVDALADPDAVMLVHCHMGVNRGPSAAFAILLALGWDPFEALDAIRDARPIAYIAYAEDALAWHHDRHGASGEQRARDQERLREWRSDRGLDLHAVIRRIRTEEGDL